jgi:thiamine kinase-like enzyme
MTQAADRPSTFDSEALTRILHRAGELPLDRRVLEVTSEPIDGGYLSDMVRLTLRYDDARTDDGTSAMHAPRSVVLKQPAEDELPRMVGTAMGMYAREVQFYRRLAPRVDVRTPRCFLSNINEETGDFVLLLEDIVDADVHAQDHVCPETDLKLALDQAAKLHASHWNDPSLSNAEWLLQLTAAGVQPWHELYQQAWQALQSWEGVNFSRPLTTLGDALASASVEAWIGGYDGPWTLTHADFHLSNLLFVGGRSDPQHRQVVVVDWQLATHASPLVDVAFLLGRMPTEHRRRVEPGLLAAYHKMLLHHGVDDYSWLACQQDYSRWLWFGVLNAAIASAAYPIAPDQLPRHVEKVERFLIQALDHDSLRYLG